jgi:hypothetical protein
VPVSSPSVPEVQPGTKFFGSVTGIPGSVPASIDIIWQRIIKPDGSFGQTAKGTSTVNLSADHFVPMGTEIYVPAFLTDGPLFDGKNLTEAMQQIVKQCPNDVTECIKSNKAISAGFITIGLLIVFGLVIIGIVIYIWRAWITLGNTSQEPAAAEPETSTPAPVVTAETIRMDATNVNTFIDVNFQLTNRAYFRAMWEAMLDKANELKLELVYASDQPWLPFHVNLGNQQIAALQEALSDARDRHLYGKRLEDENLSAHSFLTEMLSAAALQGYVFKPVDEGGSE